MLQSAREAAVSRALLCNAQARSTASVVPVLSARYAASFASALADAMSDGGQNSVARRELWSDDVDVGRVPPADPSVDLPEWYARHNPMCERCCVPALPGITAEHHGWREKMRGSLHSRCTYCGATRASSEVDKRSFPSVRQRRAYKDEILAGKTRELTEGLSQRGAHSEEASDAEQHGGQHSAGQHSAEKRAEHSPQVSEEHDEARAPAKAPAQAKTLDERRALLKARKREAAGGMTPGASPAAPPSKKPKQDDTKAKLREMLAQDRQQKQQGTDKPGSALSSFFTQL